MKFVIRMLDLAVESIEEIDGRPQPVWTPTHERALRFDSYEEAARVWRQHQDNTTMRGAEIVPVES
ncbi:MAG TPA: hypothetical protein VJM46_01500 [Candidatus Saccharimonadales bacterium]|nr:hypothetical protein [Candidatus Saccharimonadales bacterium]